MLARQSVPSRRRGITLVEVLTVIGVMGILLALLLPAVQQARARSVQASCLNRMRQVGLGLHNYHATHDHLPPRPSRSLFGTPDSPGGMSWQDHILPYVDQSGLWSRSIQAFRTEPWPDRDPPHVALGTVIPTYTCPADGRMQTPFRDAAGRTAAFTSYLGVSGGFSNDNDGVLTWKPGIRFTHVTDGTSQTLMLGERPPSARMDSGWWYTISGDSYDYLLPAETAADIETPLCPGVGTFGPGRIDNQCDKYHFWSLHPGGANFVFADGSARLLSYSVRPHLRALATRSGGEVVDLP